MGGCRYLLVLGSSLMAPSMSSQFLAEGQWGLSKDQQGGAMSSCRGPQWWGSWSSQHTEILYLCPSCQPGPVQALEATLLPPLP